MVPMCGAEAMEAGARYAEIPGCSTAESILCHDFAATLVKCAAGVLEGTKPLALFSFAPKLCWSADDRKPRSQMIRCIVSAYREGLAAAGGEMSGCRDRLPLSLDRGVWLAFPDFGEAVPAHGRLGRKERPGKDASLLGGCIERLRSRMPEYLSAEGPDPCRLGSSAPDFIA